MKQSGCNDIFYNWQYFEQNQKMLCLTLSGLTLWNTSRGRGGGRSAHPLIMAIGGCFHYFLLARALSLDVKGQNLKAQLSTSENIALRAFGKTAIFCKI